MGARGLVLCWEALEMPARIGLADAATGGLMAKIMGRAMLAVDRKVLLRAALVVLEGLAAVRRAGLEKMVQAVDLMDPVEVVVVVAVVRAVVVDPIHRSV